MITFFASPKPFTGHIGLIQRNAIASWRRLGDDVQIVLFGDESGIEEAARIFGAEHRAAVAKNDYGTPLLSDMLSQTEEMARHQTVCFINSDVMLTSDFPASIERVKNRFAKFLVIGRCWNLDITKPVRLLDENWEREIKALVDQKGTRRDAFSIDYFVFPKGLYGKLPDFAIGRGFFDNWLVWKPLDLGAAVINASRAICAIHQNHDYAHVNGGRHYAHRGEEANENFQLAGGNKNMCSIHNATHRLVGAEIELDIIGSYFPRRTRAFLETIWVNFLNAVEPLRANLTALFIWLGRFARKLKPRRV